MIFGFPILGAIGFLCLLIGLGLIVHAALRKDEPNPQDEIDAFYEGIYDQMERRRDNATLKLVQVDFPRYQARMRWPWHESPDWWQRND